MVTKNKNTQNRIEIHLQTPLETVLKKDNTFKQTFGNLKEWIFQEGIFLFMLNPINRRWLFWDSFHNDWEDTGYYAGEVEFVWENEKLLTKEISVPKTILNFDPIAELVTSNDLAQKYPLPANTLIGNERNSDIKIEETDIQALILQHAGGFTFFSLGKKDAIFVNYNTVPQEGVLLHDGDRIILGKTEFNFMNISKSEGDTGLEIENMKTDSEVAELEIEKEEEIIYKDENASQPASEKREREIAVESLVTSLNKCPSCGAPVSKNQKFCTNCGYKLPTTMFCPNCGAEFKAGAKFCTQCGAKISTD